MGSSKQRGVRFGRPPKLNIDHARLQRNCSRRGKAITRFIKELSEIVPIECPYFQRFCWDSGVESKAGLALPTSLRRFRHGDKLNAMRRLLWIVVLACVPVCAQSVDDATELLRKAQAFAESTRSWRAEIVETVQMSGGGMNRRDEVRTTIAAQPLLKMRRQNSGSDRTVLVCDGVETFYSGDGHSYHKGEARVTPQCDLPLSRFYELDNIPASASVSFMGRDHVQFGEGERRCVVVRAAWKQGTVNVARTMCIDPARPLILRDIIEGEDERTFHRD